jgi:Cu+-exporting ATPase
MASAEMHSSHPLAQAIVREARNAALPLVVVNSAEETSGHGTSCIYDGRILKAGKLAFVSGRNPPSTEAEVLSEKLAGEGKITVWLSRDAEILGAATLADMAKEDSRDAIRGLHEIGITTALVSGDNAEAVAAVAREVGIDEVEAEVLPEDKISRVTAWQQRGKRVAMVGDGINDAPALAQADIGIAIGSGTDIAKETGDVVLVRNSIMDAVRAVRLGRKTLRTIKENFFWAFFYNILMIPVAAGILYPLNGLVLRPEWACIAMWVSSITVVGNSLLLKRFEEKI